MSIACRGRSTQSAGVVTVVVALLRLALRAGLRIDSVDVSATMSVHRHPFTNRGGCDVLLTPMAAIGLSLYVSQVPIQCYIAEKHNL